MILNHAALMDSQQQSLGISVPWQAKQWAVDRRNWQGGTVIIGCVDFMSIMDSFPLRKQKGEPSILSARRKRSHSTAYGRRQGRKSLRESNVTSFHFQLFAPNIFIATEPCLANMRPHYLCVWVCWLLRLCIEEGFYSVKQVSPYPVPSFNPIFTLSSLSLSLICQALFLLISFLKCRLVLCLRREWLQQPLCHAWLHGYFAQLEEASLSLVHLSLFAQAANRY